jgi:hypothetical protein
MEELETSEFGSVDLALLAVNAVALYSIALVNDYLLSAWSAIEAGFEPTHELET